MKHFFLGAAWLVTLACVPPVLAEVGPDRMKQAYAAYAAKDYVQAASTFRELAAEGNAGAMYNLGLMYRKGRGVKQSDAEAVQWYARAVERGSPIAMCNLAYMYENGLGIGRDAARSVQLYLQSAEAGYDEGMYNAGLIYESGRPEASVAANDARARDWFRRAAEAGHEDALLRYVGLSLPPMPVVPGQENRKGSAEQAFAAGLKASQEGDYFSAFDEWYYAASKGEPAAMFNLGLLYHNGWGTEQSDAEALRWWYAAARVAGKAEAMQNIGFMYESGSGVPVDLGMARLWYLRAQQAGFALAAASLEALEGRELYAQAGKAYQKKEWATALQALEEAARRGNVAAMTLLASMHESGMGTPRNVTTAINWYQRASDGGDAEAMVRLADLKSSDRNAQLALYRQAAATKGQTEWSSVAQNRLQQLSLAGATATLRGIYLSASGGDAHAMYQLGNAYDEGSEGVAQDRSEALRWWQAAAQRGHVYAMNMTGYRYLIGLGTEKNPKAAVPWLTGAANAGNTNAMFTLTNLYRDGDEGIPRNSRLSEQWAQKSRAIAQAEAQRRQAQVNAMLAESARQNHEYLMKNDPQYAARFAPPPKYSFSNPRPPGYGGSGSVNRSWDIGGGQYMQIRDSNHGRVMEVRNR